MTHVGFIGCFQSCQQAKKGDSIRDATDDAATLDAEACDGVRVIVTGVKRRMTSPCPVP